MRTAHQEDSVIVFRDRCYSCASRDHLNRASLSYAFGPFHDELGPTEPFPHPFVTVGTPLVGTDPRPNRLVTSHSELNHVSW